MKIPTHGPKAASLLLRLGLAFIFLYAAIDSLREPFVWIGYLPHVLTSSVNPTLALHILAAYEIVLAAWLLSGKFVKYAALLSTLTLVGIIVANTNQLAVTFRDIGLAFAALALVFLDTGSDR